MYNPQLTENYNEKCTMPKKYKKVEDVNHQFICGINEDSICDLNGNEIASFIVTTSIEQSDGMVEIRNYESKLGRFELIGNALFLNGKFVGGTDGKVKKEHKPIFLAVLSCLLLVFVIAILCFVETIVHDTNKDTRFVIKNNIDEDSWTTGGNLMTFKTTVKKGESGTKDFIICNKSNHNFEYSFSIIEDNEEPTSFEYRIKMNNSYIENENWVHASELVYEDVKILANTEHLMTIEWRWFAEEETDITLEKEFSLKLNLSATIYGE